MTDDGEGTGGRGPVWLARPVVVDALVAAAVVVAELVNLQREVVVAGYAPPVPVPVVAGLLVLLAVPLAWRRRRPLWVVVAIGLGGGALAVADLPTLNLPVLVAVFTAGEALAASTVVAAAITAGVVAVNVLRGTLSQAPIDLVVFGAVWLLGVNLRVRRLHARDLRRRRDAELWRARSEERTRLARDLHDVVSNGVGGIYLQAVGAAALLDEEPARARTALESIERSASATLAELRTLLAVLRVDPVAGAGDGARAPTPTLSALTDLVERARAAGADVQVTVDGDVDALPSGVSTVAYRTLQEALGNAVRHGGAGPVRVDVEATASALRLRVGNAVVDGRAGTGGASDADGGWGLVGMRERIEALGGRLETHERDGRFRLLAEVPVPAAVGPEGGS